MHLVPMATEFHLPDAIAVLRRTPAALDALLRGLPDFWTVSNEGPDTWSPYDIIGHLIHGEYTDWVPRVRHIIEHGDSLPFPPFDRTAQFTQSRGKTLGHLLEEFATARADSLATFDSLNIQPEDLARRGLHPKLGAVTLAQLLATWAAHDLTHLHQISRVMAHQYREAVGPWTAFLGVMQCTGHSS
jgi:hypothetical protein